MISRPGRGGQALTPTCLAQQFFIYPCLEQCSSLGPRPHLALALVEY